MGEPQYPYSVLYMHVSHSDRKAHLEYRQSALAIRQKQDSKLSNTRIGVASKTYAHRFRHGMGSSPLQPS